MSPTLPVFSRAFTWKGDSVTRLNTGRVPRLASDSQDSTADA